VQPQPTTPLQASTAQELNTLWQAMLTQLNAALVAQLGAGTTQLCPACSQASAKVQGQVGVVLASHVVGVPVAEVPHTGGVCPLQPARAWTLSWLTQHWLPPLLVQLEAITQQRDAIACQQTGACCQLGSSPYNWPTLQAMAQAGDTFASEFTRVFLPYPSVDAVKAKHPQAVAEIEERHTGQAVHFYYCAYLQPNNKCGLWGNPLRPKLCASYPETPHVYVAKHCAWRSWQQTYEPTANTLLLSITLAEQLAQRLQASLESDG